MIWDFYCRFKYHNKNLDFIIERHKLITNFSFQVVKNEQYEGFLKELNTLDKVDLLKIIERVDQVDNLVEVLEKFV